MTQADSVHSTPPTNTSALPPIDPQSQARVAGELYFRTPVTPEEAFQAIGRLRKAARDEIDRLIRFLDDTDNHMEREQDGDEDDASFPESGSRACNPMEDDEDDHDGEPSLGSKNAGEYGNQTVWCAGDNTDMEDEHDGSEPDESDNEPSAGFDTGEPSLGWTVDGCTSGGIGQARWDVQDDLEVSL